MLTTSLVFYVVCALVVFWVLGAYNRLVGLRSQVVQALQVLATQWQANAQGLRSEIADLSRAPDSDSAWASLGDDAASWRLLAQSARQFQACLAALAAKPHALPTRDDLSSASAAHEVMQSAWQRLKSTHDDLAGEAVPQSLALLWQHQQQQALDKLQHYNSHASAYNHAVQQFPALLVAWIFGFKMAQLL